jgi:sterol desaturase/sphingolipid hydroxylase (fatty acid hydroxylase superfamily)
MTPDDVFSHPLFTQLALLVWGGMFVESLWLLYRHRLAFAWSEQAANLFILIVGGALRISMRGVFLIVFVALSAFAPIHWENNALSAVLCFLGVDLIFYGWHRFLHHHPFGFALHSVHHSGHTFSLSLAGRLPWPLRLVDDFVCLPLVLIGFDPLLVFLCMGVSFAAQYLVHTNAIGRLGPLDWIFNTPSNHRVHHHAVGPGQQRNFGAALMIWDRLFGTYQREEGPQPFGIADVPASNNPFEIQWQGFKRFFAERERAASR